MTTFKSRLDGGSRFVYGVAAANMLLLAGYTLAQSRSPFAFLVAGAILMVGYVPLAILYPGVRYEIGEGRLTARIGSLLTWSVGLHEIERVQPLVSRSGRLDASRLRLDYRGRRGKRHIVVTPEAGEAFMHALARSEPALLLEENSLLRLRAGRRVHA